MITSLNFFLAGFWSGLVPRVIGELAWVGLTYALVYVANTYVIEDKQMKSFTHYIASFFADTLTYPFKV